MAHPVQVDLRDLPAGLPDAGGSRHAADTHAVGTRSGGIETARGKTFRFGSGNALPDQFSGGFAGVGGNEIFGIGQFGGGPLCRIEFCHQSGKLVPVRSRRRDGHVQTRTVQTAGGDRTECADSAVLIPFRFHADQMKQNAFVESAGPYAFSRPQDNRRIARISSVVRGTVGCDQLICRFPCAFKSVAGRKTVGIKAVEVASDWEGIRSG